MGRAPCCDKANVRKGPWSPDEDAKLKEYMQRHDSGGNWIALPQKAGLRRCGKSCRLRWLNYLRPNIKHGEFTDDEDRLICSLFTSIGSRWSVIAGQLPGRTDNDIKNYWNTKLKKKLLGNMPNKWPLHSSQSLHINLNSQISSNYNQYYNTSSFSASSTAVGPASSNSIMTSSFTAPSLPMNGNYNHTNQIGENLGFMRCFSNGVDDGSSRFLISETWINGNDQKGEKDNCLGHENPLDYSMEDIKQLISTSHVTTNLNFFVDEIKRDGTLYY